MKTMKTTPIDTPTCNLCEASLFPGYARIATEVRGAVLEGERTGIYREPDTVQVLCLECYENWKAVREAVAHLCLRTMITGFKRAREKHNDDD